ncbi:hypothetical protein [Ideonella sp.]
MRHLGGGLIGFGVLESALGKERNRGYDRADVSQNGFEKDLKSVL